MTSIQKETASGSAAPTVEFFDNDALHALARVLLKRQHNRALELKDVSSHEASLILGDAKAIYRAVVRDEIPGFIVCPNV